MALLLSMQVVGVAGQGQALQFHSDAHKTVKMGRVQSAQVWLDDPKVARVHAIVELSATEASLVDMGSTQGTSVNGAKVSRVKLNDGDVITAGETQVKVGLTLAVARTASGAQPISAPSGSVASPPHAPAQVQAQTRPPAPDPAPAKGATDAGQAPAAAPLGFSEGPSQAPAASQAAPSGRAADVRTHDATAADGEVDMSAAVRLASQTRLRAAGALRPHPALPPEAQLTQGNRLLELRLYWGDVLLGMYHYRRPKQVTIGESRRADIFMSSEGLSTDRFAIVGRRDREMVLSFSDKMAGEVQSASQTRSLAQLMGEASPNGDVTPHATLQGCYTMPLALDSRVLLHWSGLTFAMRFVPPAQLLPAPFGKDFDTAFINSFLFSAFTILLMVAWLTVYPHNTEALRVDLFGAPDRFASLILEAPKDDKSTRDMLEKIKKQVEVKREDSRKNAKVDDRTASSSLHQPAKLQPAHEVGPKSQSQQREEISRRFDKLLSGGAGHLLGGGGAGSLSGSLQNAIGTAGEGTSSAGLLGLGIRGTGALTGGGIGTSRGLAGIGTSGRLGGGGGSYGMGVGKIGHGATHNLVDLEVPTVEGALSADVIKRVINENKNQVRYCYEIELQHNQNLEGRVLMHWIIGPSGEVTEVNVKESTLRNANVENCLMAKIRTWKFPSPAGGGTVEVNYPFIFKAS